MALMCNGYRLGFSPFRYRCGALVSIYTPARTLQALGGAGTLRGIQWLTGNLTAQPQGNNHPSAWMIPQTGGGMASHNRAKVTVSASGVGAEGFNLEGDATLSVLASALGGLIAGGVGTTTISISASGDVLATIGAPGSATVTISGSADPGALGWLVGDATVEVDGSMISYALGHMEGSTVDNSVLTIQAIVAAILAAAAADPIHANVKEVNDTTVTGAGTTGDPWGP